METSRSRQQAEYRLLLLRSSEAVKSSEPGGSLQTKGRYDTGGSTHRHENINPPKTKPSDYEADDRNLVSFLRHFQTDYGTAPAH
jgi:hypothetical protein